MAKRRRAGAIRVGVVGVRRGASFARGAERAGMKLAAVCDVWEQRLKEVGEQLKVATYTDYDRFLEHDVDAVILANFFHEHAPFAIKALKAGKHVMSECSACKTLAEGVALARAVEKSGKIYMFAENYPYMVFNQEMRRLYHKGLIGEFKYGEGEYVHPIDRRYRAALSPGVNHWRNWIPGTYYCTHSIAPIMFITDTRPVKVNGFVVPYDPADEEVTMTCVRRDPVGLIILRMDNGAVAKSLHGHLRGHGVWVRIHGNKGLMENLRHGDRNAVRVRREPFDKKKGEPVERVYTPDFPHHHDLATRAGHGGGDFWTNFDFVRAIREGKPPYLDVYRGIDMSICGILAYRSALNDSAPLEVPDFRKESVRRGYAKDDWSPDPADRGPGQPFSSITGHVKPSNEALAYSREVWEGMGYTGR